MKLSTGLSRDVLLDRLLNSLDAHLGVDSEQDFEKYKDDPVGFCEEVLGETLTDDVKRLMESVRDNTMWARRTRRVGWRCGHINVFRALR